MARGEVRYRLVADSKDFERGVDAAKRQVASLASDMTGKLGPAGEVLSKMGPAAVVAAAGIGTLVAAAGAAAAAVLRLASYADRLSALKDQTGLSTTALQKFELAAKLGNSSLEGVASAVNKMQRALVNGDAAFGKLGLSITDLKKLSPEEQFKAVAVAIEKLDSPAEKVAARMAVFGKSGNELAGTLKAVAEGAADVGGELSENTVAAAADLQDKLDALETAWDRVLMQMAGVIAKNPELVDGLTNIITVLANLATWIDKNSERLSVFLSLLSRVSGVSAIGDLARMATGGGAQTSHGASDSWGAPAGGRHFGGAAEDAAARAAIRAAQAEFEARTRLATNYYESTRKAEEHLAENKRRTMEVIARETEKNAKEQEQEDLDAVTRILNARILAIVKEDQELQDLNERERRRQEELQQEHIRALQEAGSEVAALSGLFQAMGGDMDSTFGHILQGLQDGFSAMQEIAEGHVITGALHAMTAAYQNASVAGGALTGAMAGFEIGGPIGAGIGAIAGGLLGLAGAADKARRELKQAHQALEQFASQYGGLEQLKHAAEAAGISLAAVFDARNPQAMQQAIQDVQEQLGLFDTAMQKTQDAMDRWGLTINDMGPAWRQQELDKQAGQLWEDWQLLIAAGVDINTLIEKMGPGFAQYLDTVVSAGSTIPAAMKPVIDQMYEEGKLLHENGEAYTQAEYEALKYGESQSAVFARFADEIEQLIEALNRMAGIKPVIRPVIVPPDGMGEGDDGTGPGRRGGPHDEGYAEGTGGFMNFGAGTPTTLHGMEAVVTPGDLTDIADMLAARMGGGGGCNGHPIVMDGAMVARVLANRDANGYGPQKRLLRQGANR